VRFTDDVGSLPPDYEEGASVNAIYNPANVREARIKSWRRLWLAPTLLCFVGLLPILVGISALWFITALLDEPAINKNSVTTRGSSPYAPAAPSKASAGSGQWADEAVANEHLKASD
jgi:hypothetical protein